MKPILLLDVDGVLNVVARSHDPSWRLVWRHGPDGVVRRLCVHLKHAHWLSELAATYELVWCTTWGSVANEQLAGLWGLPPLEAVLLPTTWENVPLRISSKTPYVAAWAAGRRLAWVDDDITALDGVWLTDPAREVPVVDALTLGVNPSIGLTRRHVDELLDWA